jgi:hypothetical protein
MNFMSLKDEALHRHFFLKHALHYNCGMNAWDKMCKLNVADGLKDAQNSAVQFCAGACLVIASIFLPVD